MNANPEARALGIDPGCLAPGWKVLVEEFFSSPTGGSLLRVLAQRRSDRAPIFPDRPLRALELTPFEAVRVVILGQDPYHGQGQAHGLAFSVPERVPPPPSLRNIFAELRSDLRCAPPASGNLERWAAQGVLLLNAVLTVEQGRPASHAGLGWETLTDALVAALAAEPTPRAFLLWGAHAQRKRALIEAGHAGHLVLAANHPSPLSARRPPVPFLGCRHFSRVNEFLAGRGRGTIQW